MPINEPVVLRHRLWTSPLRRGRDAGRWVVSAGVLLLASCHGPQSALAPAGHGAERIADLFWWMAGGASIVWLSVISLAVYSLRHPESHSQRGASLLIIGGGAVLPTVILAGLLTYGLALYYGSLQALSSSPTLPETTLAIERGKAIASYGIPSQRVPSCVHCHGPGTARRNPIYPLLAGQYANYLILQLELFKKGHRGGSAYAHLMHPVATRLNPEQMRDVALYYESLIPIHAYPAR